MWLESSWTSLLDYRAAIACVVSVLLLSCLAYLVGRPNEVLTNLREDRRASSSLGYRIPLSTTWLGGVIFVFFLSPWVIITWLSAGTLAYGGRYREALLFGLVAVLIGAAFLTKIYRLLSVVKFGNSSLKLARPFGVLGEQLTGEILIPHVMPWYATGEVVLRCSSQRRFFSQTLWESAPLVRKVSVIHREGVTSIPFRFAVPSTGHETYWGFMRQVTWVIDATVCVSGIDFHAQFQIPVVAQPGFEFIQQRSANQGQ